jgi:hypothetical protein
MRRPLTLSILILAFGLGSCNTDPDRPESQARTLQPYPVHALPLGIRLDSLQKVLHGHSALFTPVVEGRLYRIIPLNAYENLGYGAVELYPDSTIRTYYWYTNIEALTQEQHRYYRVASYDATIKPVVDALTSALGTPTRPEPYPNEEWYTWRNDTATINLTVVNKELTLTKTGATKPIAIDTTSAAPELKPKAAIKKAAPKKKVVAKKTVQRKKPVAKRAATKRTSRKR